MIVYESKISKVLNILSYVVTLPAVVFIILYWTKNNELFLTLTFVCMDVFLLLCTLANLLEIKHCLRKEEKKTLFVISMVNFVGFIIFFILLLTRIF